MATDKQQWEAVLAAVEADMLVSGAMMSALAQPVPAGTVGPFTNPLGPMTLGPVSLELPPLEQMPAVPPELGRRIESLRADIAALQTELAAEMAELRTKFTGVTARPNGAVNASHFVDRRI